MGSNTGMCSCNRSRGYDELKERYDKLPDTWARLVALEEVLGQMKSKPLEVIAND